MIANNKNSNNHINNPKNKINLLQSSHDNDDLIRIQKKVSSNQSISENQIQFEDFLFPQFLKDVNKYPNILTKPPP
jgi:hypothetical protein